LKLLGTILSCFILLSACQNNEQEILVLDEENPEIEVKLSNEEINTVTSIYCWNDCISNEHFTEIDLTELTKGLEPIPIAWGTEVEIATNTSDEPSQVSYFKLQNNNFVQKSLKSNFFDIYGQGGLKHYMIVVDWYEPNRNELIGRAGTNFVVELGE
jgi:hypothetical protein